MGELLRLPFTALLVVILSAGALPAQAKKVAAGKAAKAAKAEEASGDSSQAPTEGAEGAAAPAGPELKPADFWILDFRFQRIGMIQPTEGIHKGELYWYLIYQIENRTAKDRSAYISVTARSNKNRTYASLHLSDLEAMIERKLGKPLYGKNEAYGDLEERKKGGDRDLSTLNYSVYKAKEARDCVAIFNKIDPQATKITVTVEGLSNDFKLQEKTRQIVSRIFQLEFERPGDEYEMNLDQFRLVRSYWSRKTTEFEPPKASAPGGSKAK